MAELKDMFCVHWCLFTKYPVFNRIDSELINSTKFVFIYEQRNEYYILLHNENERKVYEIRVNKKFDTILEKRIIEELSNKTIIDINSGCHYVMCLTENSHVFAWGDNCDGQLGNGTRIDNNIPMIVEKLIDKRIVGISCGFCHTLAMSSDGKVYAWGRNREGQLGIESNKHFITTPTLIHSFALNNNKITAISCGEWHSLALTENGTVYGWGCNYSGQCGDGSDNDKRFRNEACGVTRVILENNIVVKKICCGPHHSLLLTSEGYVYSFGNNDFGQLGRHCHGFSSSIAAKIESSAKFIDIYSNNKQNICIALSESQKCFVWGKCGEEYIKIPRETQFESINETILIKANKIDMNIRMKYLFEKYPVFHGIELKAINCTKFVLVCKKRIFRTTNEYLIYLNNENERKVYEIRVNEEFDTILGEKRIVEELSNTTIIDIACGSSGNTMICLSEDSQVFTWGSNSRRELGNETLIDNNIPTIVNELNDKNIVSISCGYDHTLALSCDGNVYVWGGNISRQLGIDSKEHFINTPTLIHTFARNESKIIGISCGGWHSMALTQSGDVFSWGDNRYGQCGDGSDDKRKSVTRVKLENDIVIKKISCGRYHSLLLTSEGDVYSFGANVCGQLGRHCDEKSNVAIKIESTVKFIDIYSNHSHDICIALSDSQKFFVWGKCGEEDIKIPRETQFESINEVILFYCDIKNIPKAIKL